MLQIRWGSTLIIIILTQLLLGRDKDKISLTTYGVRGEVRYAIVIVTNRVQISLLQIVNYHGVQE